MRFNVITLFPEMIREALKIGVVGQAFARGEAKIHTVNPRDFTVDVHHSVDDRPFGGGDGMVMQYGPLKKSLDSLGIETGRRVWLSAHGQKWQDSTARAWAHDKHPITLICGRYGGVDQRFINECVDEQVSIGDYILSGGELAALVVVDSIVRFLPHTLGNVASAQSESFAQGLLEAPQFTRPQKLGDLQVPKIFLSGDHSKIRATQRLLSLLVTLQNRPDLMSEVHFQELKKSARLLREFSLEELQICGLEPKFVKEHCEFF